MEVFLIKGGLLIFLVILLKREYAQSLTSYSSASIQLASKSWVSEAHCETHISTE